MTSYLERECLYRAAQDLEPIGDIVDLGCWFGSLTASLAAGVRANPRLASESVKIHAFDTFVWYDWMDPMAARFGIKGYRNGQSFLPAFRRATAKWESLIEVHAGDVASLPWDGRPISLLVIDAMKDEGTAKSIMTNFFPSLVPGKSLVFQQDFAHFYTSWIHLIWWRIRDHLDLIVDVPHSGGALFRYRTAIPQDSYDEILDIGSATDDEWKSAFAHSRGLVRKDKVHMIAAAEVMRFVHAKRGRAAAEAAASHRDHGNWGPEMDLAIRSPEWKHHVSTHWAEQSRNH